MTDESSVTIQLHILDVLVVPLFRQRTLYDLSAMSIMVEQGCSYLSYSPLYDLDHLFLFLRPESESTLTNVHLGPSRLMIHLRKLLECHLRDVARMILDSYSHYRLRNVLTSDVGLIDNFHFVRQGLESFLFDDSEIFELRVFDSIFNG